MRMFLVGCIILFILVIITAAVKTKNSNQQATRKRRREHKKNMSTFGADTIEAEEAAQTESPVLDPLDADAALGLKEAERETLTVNPEPEFVPEPPAPTKPLIKHIVFQVMAPSGQLYSGYELLQALLANGLRYGKDKIFHRYQQKSGLGDKIFSLATVNSPGIFDLPNMGSFSCPGLVLFMVLKGCSAPKEGLDLMLETANNLTEDLGGEVWDERRLLLTSEAVIKLRSQLDDYLDQTRTEDLFT